MDETEQLTYIVLTDWLGFDLVDRDRKVGRDSRRGQRAIQGSYVDGPCRIDGRDREREILIDRPPSSNTITV